MKHICALSKNVRRLAVIAAVVIASGCSYIVPWLPYTISPEVQLDEATKKDILAPANAPPAPAVDEHGSYAGDYTGVINACTRDNLTHAFRYAEYAKDRYAYAGKEYGSLSSSTAVILIPMGAAAAGLGITGQSGVPLTALGAATATGLGLGSWLQNKPRESVYTAGQNAIECLIENMQPFCIQSVCVEEELGNALHGIPYLHTVECNVGFPEDKDLLWWASLLHARLSAAYHTVHVMQSNACNQGQMDFTVKKWLLYAHKVLRAAKAAEDADVSAVIAGRKFEVVEDDSAASTLTHGVDSVNTTISDALRTSERDIQSLASNLNSTIPEAFRKLGVVSTLRIDTSEAKDAQHAIPPTVWVSGKTDEQLCSGPAGPELQNERSNEPPLTREEEAHLLGWSPWIKKGLDGSDTGYWLDATMEAIKTDLDFANVRAQTMAAIIGSNGLSKINDCKKLAMLSGVKPPLSVDPSGKVEMSLGGKKTLEVSGGTPPYSAKPVGNILAGFSVSVEGKDDPSQVQMTASSTGGDSHTGDTAVYVSDSGGMGMTVDVSVQPAPTPSATSTKGATKPNGLTAKPRELRFSKSSRGPKPVTIANNTAGNVTITGVVPSSGFTALVAMDNCKDKTLAHNGSCQIQVTAAENAPKSGTLTVSGSGGEKCVVSLTVTK